MFCSAAGIPIRAASTEVGETYARQVVTVETADMEVAQLLGVTVNATEAEMLRVFTDADNGVIYLGEVTYRGDFIHLEMDLTP